MNTNTLGGRLKEARESISMTQEELGKLIGVTGVTIMRYEKGQREPSFALLQKIAEMLHTSPDYLVGWNTGFQLSALRNMQNLSREEVAARAGITAAELERYETKQATPKVDVLVTILEALHIPFNGTSETYLQAKKIETELDDLAETINELELNMRKNELFCAFLLLNQTGQQIAIERLKELGKIPDYQNPEAIASFHALRKSGEPDQPVLSEQKE